MPRLIGMLSTPLHVPSSNHVHRETAEQHKLEFYLPYGTEYLEAEKLGLPVGWTEDFWGKRYPKTYTGPKRN